MKFSKYNFIQEMDYGLLVYNMLNSKYVKLKNESLVEHFNELLKSDKLDLNDAMVKGLYDQGYIVDDTIDEYELAKSKINLRIKSFDKDLLILLYVTEQCNFRCIYCPEKHVSKCFSDKNWGNLYKYIEKNVENGRFSYININFFGGEPLLEFKSILKFLKKLDKLNQRFSGLYMKHNMITNGYLLTPDVYDKLTKFNVKHYQITLDGFADSHDSMRPRVDGGSTWEKIVDNLRYINSKDDGVSINLRSNINKINQDKATKFIEWESKVFDNKKFVFSAEAVSTDSGDVPNELAGNYLSEEFLMIDSKLNEISRNFNKEQHPHRILGMSCPYSVIRNYYTITTDAKVSKCGESALGMAIPIGEFTSDGDLKFYDNYTEWTENFETTECEICEFYPLCGARSCAYKKIVSKDGKRLDCENMKKIVSKFIIKYLQEGFLD